MNNLKLVALLSVVGLVACTQETIVKKADQPADGQPADGQPADGQPADGQPADGTPTDQPKPLSTPDACIDGQDLDAADIDITACPTLPKLPEDAPMAGNKKDMVSLGAWEIGTTKEGDTYKYGSFNAPGTDPFADRTLSFMEETGSTTVNKENLECWAKGYYRLRKILQDPPAEYVTLRKAGFQYRFFQFQTDLRNGPTGYKSIASFQDHLVKWVTVVNKNGSCTQPTLSKFREYAKGELTTRGIAQPGGT